MTLHTDIPTHTEIERLLATQDGLCVSIYVATTSITPDADAGRIELKNLGSAASDQLEAAGADRATILEFRESLSELTDDADFWAEQSQSLALFASAAGMRTFRLPNRLTSKVTVADRFYVKPLLRAITFRRPGLPGDAASAAGKASIADRSPSGKIQGSEGQKVRLRQYARKVDQALRGVLTGLELPLILAATGPLDAIYRSLNSYPHLLDVGIPGSPENASDEELAAEARRVLDGVYARELAAIRERFAFSLSRGLASSDVATVARASTQAAVDTLLVDIDEKMPGEVDDETGAVTLSDDDHLSYGVVDEIARRVLLAGGDVLAVRADDLPEGASLAAIFRYPL